MYNLSKFGDKFTKHSGILKLMDDLGKALATDKKIYMLGGGNPAHVPQIQEIYKNRMAEIMNTPGEFESMITNYDSPQGNQKFLTTIANFFVREIGWNVTSKNVAIVSGSQSGFFILFNILAGEFGDGKKKKILLPLAPEYIGYADQGLSEDFFVSFRPEIEFLDKHTFKYKIDFGQVENYLAQNPNGVGAICLSRPTNPTGNVVTDEEIAHLKRLSKQYNIPLIIDNAYGFPFPNVIFADATLEWDENTILSMSLSKFGLPTSRTGIIVAREEIIDAVSKVNAILSLANGSYGQVLSRKFFEDRTTIEMSENIIRPFYKEKSEFALKTIAEKFDPSLPWYVHKNEGSFFLWMWFRDLPISTRELYKILKEKNVLIVPGEYFFPGMSTSDWSHTHECVRLNYARSREEIEVGLGIIADVIGELYA